MESVLPSFMDSEGGDRKIAFICSKGNLDMAYPALIMANGALGEGIEVHIFFTFWGMDMVNKNTMNKLKFTPMGNTAMHPPGRHFRISMPQWLSGLPGMTWIATRMLRKQIADQGVPPVPEFLDHLVEGVPPVPEFLDHLVESGAELWACKMSVDMMELTMDDMHDGVSDIINVTSFMELSDDAQVIFV
jgi:peroxiredoxin family protein